jgi:hypothetical protein
MLTDGATKTDALHLHWEQKSIRTQHLHHVSNRNNGRGGKFAEVHGRIVGLDVANHERPFVVGVVLEVESLVLSHLLRVREQNDRIVAVSASFPQHGVLACTQILQTNASSTITDRGWQLCMAAREKRAPPLRNESLVCQMSAPLFLPRSSGR